MFEIARSIRISTQACTPAADSGPPGPTGQSLRQGRRSAVAVLAADELAGCEVTTGGFPETRRT